MNSMIRQDQKVHIECNYAFSKTTIRAVLQFKQKKEKCISLRIVRTVLFNLFLFSGFWAHLNFCATLMNQVYDIEVDRTKVQSALHVLGTSFLSFRGIDH